MSYSKIESIIQEATLDLAKDDIVSSEKITEIKNKYLSKKSMFMSLMSEIGKLPVEERKCFGESINKAKETISKLIQDKENAIKEKELKERLESEKIDISLPGISLSSGGKNPFFIVRDQIIDIFVKMGYTVKEGPEIELDHYNFELLNIPKNHPARDMQDSFYIDNETLLRTHTSPAQAHAMQEAKGEPIKIICPGKTYRRDDDDLTHSHQFAQIEGLVIDKNINVGNLQATLQLFVNALFGPGRNIRLRSSYFPFTEPSFELDVSCANCGGKGCSMCKGTGYIEILGCGMVNPVVLKMNGYDPDKYSGFAFGVGIERMAFLKYGIDNIRRFYQNDVRFLKQFKD